VRPINKNLICVAIEEPEKKGSIILPTVEKNTHTLEVLYASENHQGIKVGDRVLLSRYKASETEIDGKVVFLLSCDDVLAIL
jgi:co-chaperonin GroES (HSP10)